RSRTPAARSHASSAADQARTSSVSPVPVMPTRTAAGARSGRASWSRTRSARRRGVSGEGIDRSQDLARWGAHAEGIRPVDPADRPVLVDEEARRHEDVPAAAVRRALRDERRREGVTIANVERVHELAALVGDEADADPEPLAERLGQLRRL